MALYKKIKGQDTKIADNSIVDHSQLTGRDAYGAHPISAIRKLPEKLTTINTRLKNLEDGKVSKDQIASKETPGLLWAYEENGSFYIWTRSPIPFEPEIIENDAGGLTYEFASEAPATVEENIAGGLTYRFGGNN